MTDRSGLHHRGEEAFHQARSTTERLIPDQRTSQAGALSKNELIQLM